MGLDPETNPVSIYDDFGKVLYRAQLMSSPYPAFCGMARILQSDADDFAWLPPGNYWADDCIGGRQIDSLEGEGMARRPIAGPLREALSPFLEEYGRRSPG